MGEGRPPLDAAQLRSMMRSVPDFPVKGITFRDITPVLADADALASAVGLMAEMVPGDVTHVAGVEARGFVFGAALATRLGKGFVPVRKKGKLPAATVSEEYGLEYGKGVLEVHADAISPGDRVWLTDDLLATGGTLEAAARLIEGIGGVVAGITVMVELTGLDGWSRLGGYPHASLFRMEA